MKWLLLLLLLCGAGYAYWAWTDAHPQRAACARFADLCGADSRKQCDDALDALVKASGPEALRPSVACLKKAESCAQAAGCVAGAAGKAGLKAAEDFFKGVGESLGK